MISSIFVSLPVLISQTLESSEIYVVINFIIHEISRGIQADPTLILILIIVNNCLPY